MEPRRKSMLAALFILAAHGCSEGTPSTTTATPDTAPVEGDVLGPGTPEVPTLSIQDVTGVEEVADTGPEATSIDVPPPPDLPNPDAPCVPDCEGKDCGDDGCGFICGYCVENFQCLEGVCVEACFPDCDGKACGPNGCGGICGECLEALECGEDGLCYQPACVSDCAGKTCGPDGCGGECGLCAAPNVCKNGGCALGPCGTITEEGACQGNVAVWCDQGEVLVEEACLEGEICAYDPFASKYACVEVGECTPDCVDKECGDDGCGGLCPSACAAGWPCTGYVCTPQAGADCGGVTPIGMCIEDALWFCATDKLYSVDCTETGESCKWSTVLSKYACSP